MVTFRQWTEHVQAYLTIAPNRYESIKGGQRSLREISAELAARGHLNERGVPFSAASISAMLSK
jgi:hypothetical protein